MTDKNRLQRWFVALVAGLAFMSATAGAEPVRGGRLNWVFHPEPATLIPLNTSAGGSIDIGPKVVEGLLSYDEALQPLPVLATGWEVSPDGLRYTFKLREGVKWHDGAPFTSADVAYSILALKENHPRGRATFAHVREVQTPDPHTAILVLERPAPYLLTALAGTESPIVPRHLYEGQPVGGNPANNAPVGTGPFVFKEWVRGSHVTLERNPDYWDQPKPYLDRIVVRFVPDASARAAALESGSADLGVGAIPLSDLDRFAKLPGLVLDARPRPYHATHSQIFFNLDTPVLQDIRVRQALALAIPVAQINPVIWFGQGTPSATPIGPWSRYHDASIAPHPHDPRRAEALLDEAGLPRGADQRRFPLRLTINPYSERRVADLIRQSLQRIGVDANIESYDFATYIQKIYGERAFDVTVDNIANLFDPTVGVQRAYWSKNFKLGLPFSNAAHYQSAEADRLLEAAAVEPDEARRRELFLAFQQQVRADLPSIDLGAPPNVTIHSDRLVNINHTGLRTTDSFAEAYFKP